MAMAVEWLLIDKWFMLWLYLSASRSRTGVGMITEDEGDDFNEESSYDDDAETRFDRKYIITRQWDFNHEKISSE